MFIVVSAVKEKSKMRKERNSGVEVLKLIAMGIIVFSHAMPMVSGVTGGQDFFMNLDRNTDSIQRILILLMRYGGQAGNAVFFVCSAWYLADNDKVVWKKVFHMLADCFLISVLIMGVFLIAGYPLTMHEIICQFTPTYAMYNWYVPCYLLLYIIHPILNRVFMSISREQACQIAVWMFIIYSGLQFLVKNTFFYSHLIGFICIYWIVMYVKKYLKEFNSDKVRNIKLLLFCAIGNLILVFATNYVGREYGILKNQCTYWNTFMNPFYILGAIAAFDIAKEHYFVSKTVNYISGLTLLIYVIHFNRLIFTHLIPDIYKWIYMKYTYEYEFFWVLLVGGCLGLFGTVSAMLYRKIIQNKWHCFVDWLLNKVGYLYDAMIKKILEWK